MHKFFAAGAAITHFQQVEAKGAIFWEPLVFAIGLLEAYRVTVGWANPKGTGFNRLDPDYIPGDLGFDPLNLYPSGTHPHHSAHCLLAAYSPSYLHGM